MPLTATHIAYHHICPRKCWLFAQGLQFEMHSDLVAQGRQIHEYSYPQRSEKYSELALDGIKIDFYDAKNRVVHEIKKSDKLEPAHIAQVKYYLWVLLQYGIEATGILEYPKLRQTQDVFLTEADKKEIPERIQQIEALLTDRLCPAVIHKPYCKSCAYYDFCYIHE